MPTALLPIMQAVIAKCRVNPNKSGTGTDALDSLGKTTAAAGKGLANAPPDLRRSLISHILRPLNQLSRNQSAHPLVIAGLFLEVYCLPLLCNDIEISRQIELLYVKRRPPPV